MRKPNDDFVSLEKYSYCPVYITGHDGKEALCLIFGSDITSVAYIDAAGTEQKRSANVLHIVNLTESIEKDTVVVDKWSVVDVDDFEKKIRLVDDYKEVVDAILKLCAVSMAEILDYQQKIYVITLILAAARKSLYDSGIIPKPKSNLVISSTDIAQLVHVVFNGAIDSGVLIGKEDVDKIGEVLDTLIRENVELDLTDDAAVAYFKENAEFKIIEALPATINIDTIAINTQIILDHIKKLKDSNDTTTGDDTNNNEGV